ncbi:MAG: hypothetical protein GW906_02400 [Epsilonproteobacteria bacterium]|nr:hypothetical protein [Campylobacterota bacterium]NCO30855.1 hypothetical protein [Campylobacterota bacterium]PIV05538.1 MAG: hypothetical protein COS56_00955 [Sulfurimonas sp. CG03_land_8_20_14_0_80_36_25]PIX62808.1 MAG: hypothetical protein COZ44_11665 [Sulfurimonas sp. CG_4_10_14_3_um_filter_36_910]PIZ58804.1 MAG: hypothetical protein COY21_06650 [Sulfurimonas sp. CG_4_10_14_0_2_um_filter_36_1607]
MKTCIIVLGMHRSGTSALTGVLEKLGLELGSELLPPTPENEKGYFENVKIMDLNDRILLDNNSLWSDTEYELTINENLFDSYVKQAKDILEEEFQYSKLFAIKDPRLCIIFPVWEEALKQLNIQIKIILPHRNPFEVAKSLKTRNGFSVEKSLLLWSKHFYHAEYFSRGYERLFVDFDTLVNDLDTQVKSIKAFVGLDKASLDDIGDFIESGLKHKNISYENIKDSIPAFVREIVLLMKEHTLNETSYKVFDRLREELLASINIFHSQDVLSDVVLYKELSLEKTRLEQENQLLKKISDVALLDAEYYLEKYVDIKNAGLDPLKHFVENGKGEGRNPNADCEYHSIDVRGVVSNSEMIYAQNKELQKREQELNQKVIVIQDLEIQKEQQTTQLQNKAEQIVNLQTEHETRVQEIQELNAQMDSIVQDLVAVKESKSELEEQTREKIATLTEEIQNLTSQNANLNEEKEQQTTQLQNKAEQIANLQTQQTQLQTEHETRVQELNTQMDLIVEDLASIKECKCWIYTKPIRDLKKIFGE